MFNMRNKLLLIFAVIAFSLVSILPIQVNAQDLGDFKDDNESHYYLDAIPDNPEDDYFEEGENERGFFWFLDATEVAGEKFADIINSFANMAFTFNMFLTEMMIAALELAYEFDFINVIIDEISDIMSGITGISSDGSFTSSGIFGQLAIFVAMFAIIYAVFMLLFRRSMFQSLGAILQTVICLTIAILLFTNYAPFLKGVNQVTTEMSALVLGSEVSGGDTDETPSGLDGNNLKNKMYDNLWTMFVDRPYMYMMYGKTRLDDNLTEDRVKSILKAPEGSEERLLALQTEYEDEGNQYITHSKVWERLSFTPVYITINGITSFLIYALAFFLILFQFWFMMIAVFAPFALLIGAIPGMFNVIKRYFIELGLPLVLKIVVSFGALVVFSISEILYELDFQLGEMGARVNSTFGFYMAVVIVHWVLFALLFFLRKRIANIFVNSNRFMREMKDGLDTSTAPIKSAIKGGATVAGTVGGAMVGGAPGAMAGASVGRTAGETATGDASVGDLAQSAGKAYMYSRLGDSSQPKQGEGNEQIPQLSGDSKQNISKFMDDKEFGDDKEKVMESLEKAGIEEVSEEDLDKAHDGIMKEIEDGKGLQSNYSDMLVSNLQDQHKSKILQAEEGKLREQQLQEQHIEDVKEGKYYHGPAYPENTAYFGPAYPEHVEANLDEDTKDTNAAVDTAYYGPAYPEDTEYYGPAFPESEMETGEITNGAIPQGQMENKEMQTTKFSGSSIEESGKMGGTVINGSDIEGTEGIEVSRSPEGTVIKGSNIQEAKDLGETEIQGTDMSGSEIPDSGIPESEQYTNVSNIKDYEDRQNLASLDLDKQKPANNEFEYANLDENNLKSLEDNMPNE